MKISDCLGQFEIIQVIKFWQLISGKIEGV
jgi:hypothetical protein